MDCVYLQEGREEAEVKRLCRRRHRQLAISADAAAATTPTGIDNKWPALVAGEKGSSQSVENFSKRASKKRRERERSREGERERGKAKARYLCESITSS